LWQTNREHTSEHILGIPANSCERERGEGGPHLGNSGGETHYDASRGWLMPPERGKKERKRHGPSGWQERGFVPVTARGGGYVVERGGKGGGRYLELIDIATQGERRDFLQGRASMSGRGKESSSFHGVAIHRSSP